jgi:hypothetical protein
MIVMDKVLQKGSIEAFAAAEKINLYVSKGEAIDLSFNGNPYGSPGKGIMKNIEVTSKGIKVK